MAIKRKNFLLVLLALSLSVSTAQPQIINGRPSASSSGFVYTNWQLQPDTGINSSLGQFWVPVSGFVALQENLEARYYLAGSTNSFKVGNSESNLMGIGDTRLEITKSFAQNQLFISGGINLPTGKTKLAFNSQQTIIELLSESFLTYPMRRFGEGLGFNSTAGAALSWGTAVAGLALSYDIIGKYTPYKNFGQYNPGDVLTAEFGFNAHGDKTAVACGVNYLNYANDKMDGRKVFKQGQQVGLTFSAAYDNQVYRVNPSARYTLRGRNTRYETNSEIIRDRLKLYGNELEMSLDVARYFRGNWSFAPFFSLLQIDNNEDNYGDSQILTFGSSIGRRFSEKLTMATWFKVMSGDTDSGRINLKGYQISASITSVF